MNLNQQPPEKAVRKGAQQGVYAVQEVFYTIQGEGPLVGTPAVFVRLAGCNLQCPLCDTDYTSRRSLMETKTIYEMVEDARGGNVCDLIVLTGGEPFRQEVVPLIKMLIDHGYRVQIETNGTLAPRVDDFGHLTYLKGLVESGFLTVVVSPKTGRVAELLWPLIGAYKYVLCYGKDDVKDGLPLTALNHTAHPKLARPHPGFKGPVFLQPADEQEVHLNQLNLNQVLHNCMKFGYRLCVQTHKIVNLP